MNQLLSRSAFLTLVLALAFLLRWQAGTELQLLPAEQAAGESAWLVDDEATAKALRRVEVTLAQGQVPLTDALYAGGTAQAQADSPVPAAVYAAVVRLLGQGASPDPSLSGYTEAEVEDVLLRSGPLLGLLLAVCVHLAARALLGSSERARLGAWCAAAVAAFTPALLEPTRLGLLSEAALGWVAVALLMRSFARLLEPRGVDPQGLVDGVMEGLLAGLLAGIAVALWAPALLFVLAGTAALLRACAEPEQAPARARAGILLLLVAAFALRLPLEEGPWAASSGPWVAWVRFASTLCLILAAPFAVVVMWSKKRGEPRRVLHLALLAALVLMAVAWMPEAWEAGRTGLLAFVTNEPLAGRWAAWTAVALAGLVLCGLVLWRTHQGFLVLVTGACVVLATPLLRDGAAAAALASAFLIALLVDARQAWMRSAAPLVAGVCIVAGFVLARPGEAALREERCEVSGGLRQLRALVPSTAPWNDPLPAPQSSVLVPATHAARAVLQGRRAVPAASVVRLAELGATADFAELARGLRGLGATHVVAAPRFAAEGSVQAGGAWDQLASASSDTQRLGEFERVHASPRRVGRDLRAVLASDAATGSALSIWKLAGKPEQAPERREPEFRAR